MMGKEDDNIKQIKRDLPKRDKNKHFSQGKMRKIRDAENLLP